MAPHRNKPHSDKEEKEHSSKHQSWKRALAIPRCFGCWVWLSIRNPDNIPIYLTAIFTALLAAFAFYAWEEATRGTKALQGQLQALRDEQRPWIKADLEIASDATVTNNYNTIGFKIRIKVKNVGHSPAFNLNAWPKIVMYKTTLGDGSVEDLLKQRCDEMTKMLSGTLMLSWGNILFPGDTDEIEETVEFTVPEPPKKPEPPKPAFPNSLTNPNVYITPPPDLYVMPNIGATILSGQSLGIPIIPPRPLLLACVYYESRSGERLPHQTAESLYVTYYTGDIVEIGPTKVIPKDRLSLERPMFDWRKYAN